MSISLVVLGVYRQRNVQHVLDLLGPSDPSMRCMFWALDSPAPQLSAVTVGEGPGLKFELLNHLVAAAQLRPSEAVLVADDDVNFTRGSLREFVETAAEAEFDLAQPAHDRRSHWSHSITRRRNLSVARLTTFVEIGPVFFCGLGRRAEFVPFPENAGMGWGLDLAWHDLQRTGARLGIVDRTPVTHHVPPGVGYDIERERNLNRERLAARGVERMADVQAALATWRPWQRRPPWVR